MTRSWNQTIRFLAFTSVALSVAVGPSSLAAQSTQKEIPGSKTSKTAEVRSAKTTTTQLVGEVAYIQGDYLIAKMIPSGDHRLFHMRPGKTGTIDGVVMPLNKVRIGTVLTAYVTVSEMSVVDRTVTTLNGTVWYAGPGSVILTLENGENHQYEVPAGRTFNVDGRTLEAGQLKPGMKISATKIVEVPRTEIAESNAVTGVSPKK